MMRLKLSNSAGVKTLKHSIEQVMGRVNQAEYTIGANTIGRIVKQALSDEAPYNKDPFNKSHLEPPPGSLKGVLGGSEYGFDYYVGGKSGVNTQISFWSRVDYAIYVQNGHATRLGSGKEPRVGHSQGWVEGNDYIGRAIDLAMPEVIVVLESIRDDIASILL